MVGAGEHKLSAVLIAILDLFFFGLGFARVLQLAHARAWGIDLRKSVVATRPATRRCSPRWCSAAFLFVLQTRRSGESRPGSAGCSTSAGSRCCSASSSGRRACCSTTASPRATCFPAPSSRVLGLIALRLISVAAPRPLAELVLDDLRRVRDRDRALLLDHPRRDDPDPRRRALTRARPAPGPARGAGPRRPPHGPVHPVRAADGAVPGRAGDDPGRRRRDRHHDRRDRRRSGILMRVLDHREYPNIFIGMWWAIQTVTTVGYGDVTPRRVRAGSSPRSSCSRGSRFSRSSRPPITSTFVARANTPPGRAPPGDEEERASTPATTT